MARAAKKELVVPGNKLEWHAIFSPVQGLDYSLPTTLIGEKTTPECSDTHQRDGVVGKAPGTIEFGSTNTKPVAGSVLLVYHFKLTTGTGYLMCFTTERIYKYNAANDEWDDITAVGKNLVCRTTGLVKSSKSLVCRVTGA